MQKLARGTKRMSKTERGRRVHKSKTHLPAAVSVIFYVIYLLLQVAFLVFWFLLSREYIANFYLILEFLSLCVVLYIVREDGNSSYKIPWIILNLALPIVGGLSYIMFARVRFSREERRLLKDVNFRYAQAVFEKPDAMEQLRQESPEMVRQAEYLRNRAGAPVYQDTQVRYFSCGEKLFPELIAQLEAAQRFIFLEYFIVHPGYMWNKVEEILVRKVKQGVDVRVIYDDMGSMGLVPHDFVDMLEEKGIRACNFNRLNNIFSSRFNNRDHRKICVIDGNVGFTGGINMADEYINKVRRFGYWKDTAVMLRGQAVRSLTCMFLTMWEFVKKEKNDYLKFAPTLKAEARGFVQPYMDSPLDNERVGQAVYTNILSGAHRYVYITTPYLIIDDEMVGALTLAAKSGVDVRIVTPGVPDKKVAYTLTRSYYEVLLRAGVRIFEYTPGFIHAKEFVADDQVAVVGTVNLDYRSLCHHFECAVWMADTPAVADIREDVLDCINQSREITLDMCRNKTILWRVWLAVLRLFAPLF